MSQSLPGVTVPIGDQNEDSKIQHFRFAGLILDQDCWLAATALGNDSQKLLTHLLFGRLQIFPCNPTFQLLLDFMEFADEVFFFQSGFAFVLVVVVMT